MLCVSFFPISAFWLGKKYILSYIVITDSSLTLFPPSFYRTCHLSIPVSAVITWQPPEQRVAMATPFPFLCGLGKVEWLYNVHKQTCTHTPILFLWPGWQTRYQGSRISLKRCLQIRKKQSSKSKKVKKNNNMPGKPTFLTSLPDKMTLLLVYSNLSGTFLLFSTGFQHSLSCASC